MQYHSIFSSYFSSTNHASPGDTEINVIAFSVRNPHVKCSRSFPRSVCDYLTLLETWELKQFPVCWGFSCCKLLWPCWCSGFRRNVLRHSMECPGQHKMYREMYGGLVSMNIVYLCKNKWGNTRQDIPVCCASLRTSRMLWRTWAGRTAL